MLPEVLFEGLSYDSHTNLEETAVLNLVPTRVA